MQNPHPLLVHYPIAFLVAFAVASLLSLVVRHPSLAAFARACLFVGTAAAAVTVVSGFLAEQNVAPVAAARGDIEKHRALGYAVLALSGLLSGLAVVAPRHPLRAGAFRAAHAIGAAVLLVVLYLAGEEGGELVHEHGVGTTMTAPGGPLAEIGEDGTPAGSRLPAAGAAAPADSAPRPTRSDFR